MKIPKEIKKILEREHDDTLEEVYTWLQEHQNESAEEGLEKVNTIRDFLGNEPLNLKDMKRN